MTKFEVVAYLGKNVYSSSSFETFPEASSHLVNYVKQWFEIDKYIIDRANSSYCLTVWDPMSEKMLQLLGPNESGCKDLLIAALTAAQLANYYVKS